MGNSEVGHNALGCGQVYAQGAKLVGESIESGKLFASPTWIDLVSNAKAGHALHFLGLLSDGNVHSNIAHLIACHTGEESCFHNPVLGENKEKFKLEGLYQLLQSRKRELPEGSYTTYLFQKGLDKILKKVGEESTEVIIAGKAEDKAETIYEIADLAYHVLVLMVQMGISVEDRIAAWDAADAARCRDK